ncbi:MAG: ferritin family protein [Nitrospirae bacterium]|nr:ferritin family protein [Nitrospirota bacterium]
MITGKEDLLQALIEAFLMEKGTREFYSQASVRSADYEAQKTFKELSDWEGKHMDYIQFLYQSINGDQEVRSFEEFKKSAKAPMTEAGIPVKDLEAKIERYKFMDQKEALALAMEIEGKAYNFYRKLSGSAEDGNARVVFRGMMEQEVKHVEYLKKLRVKLLNVYEVS